MIPNVPLHSLVEPSWVVPRDASLECSLFVLEQQEKGYNDRLSNIANIAAPEPIGMRQSSISNSSANSSIVGMSGAVSRSSSAGGMSPTRSTTRTSRSSRRQSSGTNRSSTYGYTPQTGTGAANIGTGTGGASARRSIYRREASSEEVSTVASADTSTPSPIRGSTRRRRGVSTPTGSPSNSFSAENADMH